MSLINTPAIAKYATRGLTRDSVLSLSPLSSECRTGLKIATGAILQSKTPFSEPEVLARVIEKRTGVIVDPQAFSGQHDDEGNAYIASLVRDVAGIHGWLAGWVCLSELIPEYGFNQQLMRDTVIFTETYARVKVTGGSIILSMSR